MERLKNLSGINTNTIEGRLLIAAMSEMSVKIYPDKEPDTILQMVHDNAEYIYEKADDIPSLIEEQKTFESSLSSLINKHSLENGSNTPDYILADYLKGCLLNYNNTVSKRDKWFNVDVWEKVTGIETSNQ